MRIYAKNIIILTFGEDVSEHKIPLTMFDKAGNSTHVEEVCLMDAFSVLTVQNGPRLIHPVRMLLHFLNNWSIDSFERIVRENTNRLRAYKKRAQASHQALVAK